MKKINYYSISYSTNIKEIGTWKQLDPPSEYYNVPNNLKTLETREFPKTTPNLKGFTLKNKAVLTDCLSPFFLDPSLGLFISKKFLELINLYKLEGTKTYPTTIITFDDLVIDSYSFIHVIHQYYQNIDYEKSIFVDFSEDDEPEVKIDEENKVFLPDCVEPRKIVLKTKIDLFRQPYDVSILVSEDLRKAIETEGITGVEFDDRIGTEFYLDE
ncbi:DUF1629 domain-containing protein [uncultured Microscilla sp.]|uniref:imm11 family protein n=1 Tax=uncultured Microscilla sp. TaxID=432653 RepID=UPI00261A0706|nr:DUF1629 domain-containing protein [uncultured Microscilla sp.]